jgi:hypothetical protein
MSTYDLDHVPGSGARPRPARTEAPGADAGTVMSLQRLAGNSAVSRAIQGGQIGADHGQLDIQRDATTDEEESEEKEDIEGPAGDEDVESETEGLIDDELESEEKEADQAATDNAAEEAMDEGEESKEDEDELGDVDHGDLEEEKEEEEEGAGV